MFARADVIGFDIYPVEVRCSLAEIDNVTGCKVRLTNREIVALAPERLGPAAHASWSADGSLRVAARRYNGATYVVAVNTATAPATASFTVAGVDGRTLGSSAREGRSRRSAASSSTSCRGSRSPCTSFPRRAGSSRRPKRAPRERVSRGVSDAVYCGCSVSAAGTAWNTAPRQATRS